MKILLDTCLSWRAIAPLQAAGHDVDWVGNWEGDPGDEEILRRAHAENRVLVTLDNDFGELAVRLQLPHCGVVRLVDIADDKHAATCVAAFETYAAELAKCALLTVESYRVRVRPYSDDLDA